MQAAMAGSKCTHLPVWSPNSNAQLERSRHLGMLGMLRKESVTMQVGSGTDPAEGAALAGALLQQLAGAARLTFATTHHAELKDLPVSLACLCSHKCLAVCVKGPTTELLLCPAL
jgi:hypothetical protein